MLDKWTNNKWTNRGIYSQTEARFVGEADRDIQAIQDLLNMYKSMA